MAGKPTKQARTLAEIKPFLKVCLIQRLSDKDARELLEVEGYPMSERTYQRYKKEYNSGSTKRFLEIARCEWANEHILIIDKFKWIEQKYHEIFKECTEPLQYKAVLDSICKVQEQISTFYNDTPLMAKMKETLEAKLQELNDAKNQK